MKTIGLIGGTSWVSSKEYYRIINEEVEARLGGLNSAKCILYSLNLADYMDMKRSGREQDAFALFFHAASSLISSGAGCILICSNMGHFYAEELESKIEIPVIHIADVTAEEIISQNMAKAGLLGTKFTMENDFYKIRLNNNGIEVIIPDQPDRDFIDDTIFNELGKGIFSLNAKKRFLEVINKLKDRGVQGIILGCTEIPLLIGQEDTDIILFNTLEIHSKAAVDFALD
ncbi:aspartate/glutamate racemase family protein [candidate division KSB1 bacterium]